MYRLPITHDTPSHLTNLESIVLASVKTDGLALQYASNQLRADLTIVLAAVTQNGLALQYALKTNEPIVLAAIKQNKLAIQYASTELRTNRQLVIRIIQTETDRGIILAVLSLAGWALQHAPQNIKNDFEFVLAAVTQNGQALQYASLRLRTNSTITSAAVRQNNLAHQWIKQNSVMPESPEILEPQNTDTFFSYLALLMRHRNTSLSIVFGLITAFGTAITLTKTTELNMPSAIGIGFGVGVGTSGILAKANFFSLNTAHHAPAPNKELDALVSP
ncbi:MAG: DUF4116 domain-containing protein [Legionella sp.]|nr:DUF4116 domain-containing protein [Legionella sp.]